MRLPFFALAGAFLAAFFAFFLAGAFFAGAAGFSAFFGFTGVKVTRFLKRRCRLLTWASGSSISVTLPSQILVGLRFDG